MSTTQNSFGLIGKVSILSDIRVITGMRIGGSSTGIKIGGVDSNVITDPEGRPYIPGSSLKGKLRSLLEYKVAHGKAGYFDQKSGQRRCESLDMYKNDPAMQIFGTMLNSSNLAVEFAGVPTLTKLYVRDTYLDESSITDKMRANIDLAFTEVKTETAIDRIKGNAASGSLRQVERVPAGALFTNLEMIFNVFAESDKQLLPHLFAAMQLLEDDYLGGMGSRGYGKVRFENIRLHWNSRKDYETGKLPGALVSEGIKSVSDLINNAQSIITKLV